MFRIRKIQDALSIANQRSISSVVTMLRMQIPSTTEAEYARLPEQLNNPFDYRYRTSLLVAEDARGKVLGFAVLLHIPDVDAAYLEYLCAASNSTGGGIGGGLYDRVHEEAINLGVAGLFFECSVDEPELVPDATVLAQNRRRMQFYERRGARPIIGNTYANSLHIGDTDLYYMMVDSIVPEKCLRASFVREVARAVMERKYGDTYRPKQIEGILASFKDDPVEVRVPRYAKRPRLHRPLGRRTDSRIALLVNRSYNLHHVRDKGYVETPVRISLILKEILPTGLFEELPGKKCTQSLLRRVHKPDFLKYMRELSKRLKSGEAIYPEVFPIRNTDRPPVPLELKLGYYCIDGFTPMSSNAYIAAREAVDCAVTGAAHIVGDHDLAYALVRPPGHHAEGGFFGGFCYFNSAAVAAEYLSDYGRVAVLDIDFHHGNGTQSIFYDRADVLTVSIHGDPRFFYPHFAGFKAEKGEGPGEGYNVNLPLPREISVDRYLVALHIALKHVTRHRPDFLVLSLGLDTARADPTGTWPLRAADFEQVGKLLGALRMRTLVVQEGGYRTRTLGTNAKHFFRGLWHGRGMQ